MDRLTLAAGLVLVRWIDGDGMRRGLHLPIDVPLCAEVVATSAGDTRRHRVVRGEGDENQWAWKARETGTLAPPCVEPGDVVITNPRARSRGAVVVDGEELTILDERELEAVVEGWERERIE